MSRLPLPVINLPGVGSLPADAAGLFMAHWHLIPDGQHSIEVTPVAAGAAAGEPETIEYKFGATVVAVTTFTYDDNGKMATAVTGPPEE